MIGHRVIFECEERHNNYSKSGTEWALYVRFPNDDRWVVKTWKRRPSNVDIDEIKDIVLRSFEFYHKNLRIPPFHISATVVQ